MIGKVAKCKRGFLGIITNVYYKNRKLSDEVLCKGIGFNGRAWQSKDPEIIADNVDEYIKTIRKPLKTIIGLR